nr:MAG TPA: hypothetical protein [Caudoviricetes sp.]
MNILVCLQIIFKSKCLLERKPYQVRPDRRQFFRNVKY